MPPADPDIGGAPRPGRNRRVHGDTAPVVARGRGTVIPGAARVDGGSAGFIGAAGATSAGFAGIGTAGAPFDPARFDTGGFAAAALDGVRGPEAAFDTGGFDLPGPGQLSGSGQPDGARPVSSPMHEAVAPGLNRVPVTQPTQIVQPDWITQAQRRAAAEGAWTPAGDPPAWVPGAQDEPAEADQGESASLVRPYARTGGRTKPVRHLDLEALVRTTVNGKEASTSPLLSPEHSSVIALCTGTVSVAEIAARLSVPLGVARVIIADMVDLGLVEVMKTSAVLGDERDPEFLRRVLSGLQRL